MGADLIELRRAFRETVAPHLSADALARLAAACERADPVLMSGGTVLPSVAYCGDWPVERCCPIAYAMAELYGRTTCGAVDEAFAAFMAGHEVAWAFVLRWDDAPLSESLPALAAECRLLLAERGFIMAA